MVDTGCHFKNLLNRSLDLLDTDLAIRITLGESIGTKRLVDTGVDGKLIVIDLSTNRIKMHIGIAVGNLDGKYLLDLGLSRAPEQILGKLVDGCSLGTLGNTDCKRGGVNVQTSPPSICQSLLWSYQSGAPA